MLAISYKDNQATRLYYSPWTWFCTSIQPLKHVCRSHSGVWAFKFPKTTSSVCQLDWSRFLLFAHAQPNSVVKNLNPPKDDEYNWSTVNLMRCARFISPGTPQEKYPLRRSILRQNCSLKTTVLKPLICVLYILNMSYIECKRITPPCWSVTEPMHY